MGMALTPEGRMTRRIPLVVWMTQKGLLATKPGIHVLQESKGLLRSKGPICTLSQNGYGAGTMCYVLHSAYASL